MDKSILFQLKERNDRLMEKYLKEQQIKKEREQAIEHRKTELMNLAELVANSESGEFVHLMLILNQTIKELEIPDEVKSVFPDIAAKVTSAVPTINFATPDAQVLRVQIEQVIKMFNELTGSGVGVEIDMNTLDDEELAQSLVEN